MHMLYLKTLRGAVLIYTQVHDFFIFKDSRQNKLNANTFLKFFFYVF